MIRFVFLDLDDTLLDFHKSEEMALRDTLQMMNVEPTDEIISRYSVINDTQWKLLEQGKLTREEVKLRRFQILFDEFGVSYDAEAARRYYEHRISLVHYFLPNAEALLEALYGKYKLYLVSNGSTEVQNGRIKSAGIAHFFEKIFLSEEVGYVKPQREFFDACFAEIADFDEKQAIILGDSLTSDIQGGINAGIKTCWFHPEGSPAREDIVPDFEIQTLQSFLPLLKTL